MVSKVLKYFGWHNRIDLSASGIDDLKIVLWLISIFAGFIFGVIIPWMYGIVQICLLIF